MTCNLNYLFYNFAESNIKIRVSHYKNKLGMTDSCFKYLFIKKLAPKRVFHYLLNLAARRDLSREALFLWINPLEAAPSIAL